jgi:hypothetical protein
LSPIYSTSVRPAASRMTRPGGCWADAQVEAPCWTTVVSYTVAPAQGSGTSPTDPPRARKDGAKARRDGHAAHCRDTGLAGPEPFQEPAPTLRASASRKASASNRRAFASSRLGQRHRRRRRGRRARDRLRLRSRCIRSPRRRHSRSGAARSSGGSPAGPRPASRPRVPNSSTAVTTRARHDDGTALPPSPRPVGDGRLTWAVRSPA